MTFRRAQLCVALLLTSGLGALPALPTGVIEGIPYRCLSLILFDQRCYGCGMTRALSRLLHGDWDAAVRYHPHAPFWLAALLTGTAFLWWLALRKSDSISA